MVRGMSLIVLGAAVVVSVGGCSVVNDGEGFSLDDAGTEIAAATQRSGDCGDINPVLTAEEVVTALETLFEMSDGLLTFEALVAEQVALFNERADMLCGTEPDGNENENENANGNQNDNG